MIVRVVWKLNIIDKMDNFGVASVVHEAVMKLTSIGVLRQIHLRESTVRRKTVCAKRIKKEEREKYICAALQRRQRTSPQLRNFATLGVVVPSCCRVH